MWSACPNVQRMTKMIQVRDVPDDVHRTLKTRAAAVGMSLSDYVKRDLEEAATRASLEEIDGRVTARGPSKLSTASILASLRDQRDA